MQARRAPFCERVSASAPAADPGQSVPCVTHQAHTGRVVGQYSAVALCEEAAVPITWQHYAGRPVRLPWAAGSAPRFVCDTMTEGLARQLRMFGVDAASAPGGQTAKRFLVYRCSPNP